MPETALRKKRSPPELEGGDNRTQNTRVWMAGNGSAMVCETTHEGLSLSQQARYSTLRKNGHWREVRDELNGDVFYVDVTTMKTTWERRKTPFADADADAKPRRKASADASAAPDVAASDADAPLLTLREKRLNFFKTLITHSPLTEAPAAAAPTLRFRAPPPASKAPLPKRKPSASPTVRRRGYAQPTKNVKAGTPRRERQAADPTEMPPPRLYCPYTGHDYPEYMIQARSADRRAAVLEFLESCSIDAEALNLPPRHETPGSNVREHNMCARAAFKRVTEAVQEGPVGGDADFKALCASFAPPQQADTAASAFPKPGETAFTTERVSVKVVRVYPNTGYVAVQLQGADGRKRTEALKWGQEVKHYWG